MAQSHVIVQSAVYAVGGWGGEDCPSVGVGVGSVGVRGEGVRGKVAGGSGGGRSSIKHATSPLLVVDCWHIRFCRPDY